MQKVSLGRIGVGTVLVAALFHSTLVVMTLLHSPPGYRVQYVPDDSFYYLTLARNFVESGRWTFDSGVSLTSGFHLLHAYFLAGWYALVHPSIDSFVTAAIAISALSALPGLILALIYACRARTAVPAILCCLILLSRNVSLNLVSGIEWGWVVSFSAAYCLVFAWAPAGGWRLRAAVLLVLGLLGSLARTDFGLLTAALLGSSLVAGRANGPNRWRMGALAGFAGAVLGVLITSLHSLLMTSQLLQSSVRMKGLWAQGVNLNDFGPALNTMFSLLGDDRNLMLILTTVAAIAIGIVNVTRRGREHAGDTRSGTHESTSARHRALWLGCLGATVGYAVFYSFNPAVQHWYTANLLVPLFLTISIPFDARPVRSPSVLAAVIVLLVLVGRQVPSSAAFLVKSKWPYAESLYRAGCFLKRNPVDGRVGAWNAGIVGYYAGGRVVNLDGLVNNDVYDYASRGHLGDYIDKVDVRYIVDFENFIAHPEKQRRGGFADQSFLRRLRPMRRFDDSDYYWRRLTLYRVAPR